jgi:hypothetical protein
MTGKLARRHGNADKPATHVVARARSASLREPFMPLDRPAPSSKPAWQPKAQVWAQLPDTTPVALGAVTGCRWPIGNALPFLFCNATTAGGSYCAAHAEMSKPKPIGEPR